MSQDESKKSETRHTVALIAALIVILVIGAAGCISFLRYWGEGNEKAEAFSGLLTFFAAISSSIVTVIFIYLTSASLQKAQASIDLQREELEQIRASTELQKKEWEQKVRVSPKCWIVTVTGGEVNWYPPDPQYPNSNRLGPAVYRGAFVLFVWNYSEQSFIVDAVRLRRLNFAGVQVELLPYVKTVVTPHSVSEIPISAPIMRLITRTPVSEMPFNRVIREPDEQADVGVELIFSDWSQTEETSGLHGFKIEYQGPTAPMKLSRLPDISNRQ